MNLEEKTQQNPEEIFLGPDKIYYIILKTENNFPYFKEPIFCELMIEELKIFQKLKRFKLYSFSLIYDHLNLLVQPNEKCDIVKILQPIKMETSRDINRIIGINDKDMAYDGEIFQEGDIEKGNNDDSSNQVIMEGCLREYWANRLCMMKMIFAWQKMFNNKYGRPQSDVPGFKWQEPFHDYVIRDERDFIHHFSYTALNYIKHGLPYNLEIYVG